MSRVSVWAGLNSKMERSHLMSKTSVYHEIWLVHNTMGFSTILGFSWYPYLSLYHSTQIFVYKQTLKPFCLLAITFCLFHFWWHSPSPQSNSLWELDTGSQVERETHLLCMVKHGKHVPSLLLNHSSRHETAGTFHIDLWLTTAKAACISRSKLKEVEFPRMKSTRLLVSLP